CMKKSLTIKNTLLSSQKSTTQEPQTPQKTKERNPNQAAIFICFSRRGDLHYFTAHPAFRQIKNSSGRSR
ncbi:hypothetical protein, partial [Tessaracoccus caeni]|uniref:hypothetical protein n=1 Tax=Tessaracoccus caeni TaxID=3031239 RepID=UPI0023DA0F91